MHASDYKELLRPVFEGKPWLVAFDVLAGAAKPVHVLRELGASRVFALGASRGTGEVPLPSLHFDNRGDSVMEAIRNALRLLRDLPAEAEEALAAWDPEREARVITPIFDTGLPIGGRRVYGARPLAWQALEDKTVVDGLWDALGIPRAPVRVLKPMDLLAGWRSVDQGPGVVASGDSRAGFNGAAEYVRWIRNDDQAASASRFFAQHCDRVRVMPFLEGIPCSIHGLVFPDFVAAFRPMELLVFRVPQQGRFQYASACSVWDPPAADRAEMRGLARRVGVHLREALDYRGAFTLDGVMTEQGFRPTELNPRLGAALMAQFGAVPEVPLLLLNDALVEGEPLDWHPEALESLVVSAADETRHLGAGLACARRPERVRRQDFTLVDSTAVAVEQGEGTLTFGPGPVGGYLKVGFGVLPAPGSSGAPRVLAALRLADRLWDLDLGPLEAAREVR